MVTLEQLLTVQTTDQVRTSIYQVLNTIGVSTSTWKVGGVLRTLVTAVAIVVASFSKVIQKAVGMGFLDYSEGLWLDQIAYYTYAVSRLPATFATDTLHIVNSGGGSYSFGVQECTVLGASGKEYVNQSAFSVGPFGTADPIFFARESGSASNAAVGTLTRFAATYAGLSVTNARALVARDDETDVALRARCRLKMQSLSPLGPAAAYQYFALSAVRQDGTAIGVTRVRVIPDVDTGFVRVIVASDAGPLPGNIADPSTDLGKVHYDMYRWATPLCVVLSTENASAKTISVTASIWVPASATSLTDAQIKALAQAKIVELFQNHDIGGYFIPPNPGRVYHDAIKAAVGSAIPGIFHTVVSLPAGDTDLLDTEIPVIGLFALTVNRT